MKEYKIVTSSVWTRDYQIMNNEDVEVLFQHVQMLAQGLEIISLRLMLGAQKL